VLFFLFSEQATISNPETSQAAKDHSRQVIRELEGQDADSYPSRQPRVDADDDGAGEQEEAVIETNPSNLPSDDAYHGFKATLHGGCLFSRLVVGGNERAMLTRLSHLTDPNTSKEAKGRVKAELEQRGVAFE